MAVTKTLASFPNSRIKPRPATRVRTTEVIDIAPLATVQVLFSNANRTNAFIRNLDSSIMVLYDYDAIIDGTPTDDGGEINAKEQIEIDAPEQEVWIFNPDGASTVSISIDDGEG